MPVYTLVEEIVARPAAASRASTRTADQISEYGYGKRTDIEAYRLQSRGGKGVINMKTTKKTGPVVDVLNVKEDTDLMIITKDGKIIRIEAADIRQAGRGTQGVRLVKMDEGDAVADASVVPDGNGDEDQAALELE